ncbi:MAG: acetamidase/formamidase family protein [Chloroflexales bacterium]|nr:acetamidase/formamidase family protein [Chloroflexales bacterium]
MATHHFQPTHYHTTMGSHAPVLRIAPGDRVHTTTVDAGGRDATNTPITPGGNPQTGPFYVAGAAVSDTLVLHLEQIAPNRSSGWTGKMIAANVVDPHYVPELPWHPKDQPYEPAIWDIDTAAGTATLRTPETKLGRLALPLAPMLGCFGVAPARGQAISTATSAEHGGNMDYRGFVAGVTVYFPVLVEGALLHLGDGHAIQGDGEIAGTGIEISMDVTFSVELIKGKQIAWPRGENADYIFTVGNARPLDQCVQHATTEMIRWLESDYGLDPLSVSILMGQTVEYDLGNIFDPAYTMVCKMPKRVLAALRAT